MGDKRKIPEVTAHLPGSIQIGFLRCGRLEADDDAVAIVTFMAVAITAPIVAPVVPAAITMPVAAVVVAIPPAAIISHLHHDRSVGDLDLCDRCCRGRRRDGQNGSDCHRCGQK